MINDLGLERHWCHNTDKICTSIQQYAVVDSVNTI